MTMSDFAHRTAKGESFASVIGTRSTLDADRHVVVLTVGIFMGNEARWTWDNMNIFAARVIPHFRDLGSIDITDANINSRCSSMALNGKNQRFMDFNHMVKLKGPVGRLGKEAVEVYTKLYKSVDIKTYDYWMSVRPENLVRWMKMYSEAELFPLKATAALPMTNQLPMTKHGSPAESENDSRMHREIRRCGTSAFLPLVAKLLYWPVMEHQAEAHKHNPDNRAANEADGCSIFPKRLWRDHYHAAKLKSQNATIFFISLSTDKSQCYMETSLGTSTVTFSKIGGVNPGLACNRLCGAGEGVPCVCVWIACAHVHRSVHRLLDPRNTTAGWEKQYAALKYGDIPNLEIDNLPGQPDYSLMLPPATAAAAGRPKKGKRHVGIADRVRGEKQQKTCYLCLQPGHTCKTCPEREAHANGTVGLGLLQDPLEFDDLLEDDSDSDSSDRQDPE